MGIKAFACLKDGIKVNIHAEGGADKKHLLQSFVRKDVPGRRPHGTILTYRCYVGIETQNVKGENMGASEFPCIYTRLSLHLTVVPSECLSGAKLM